jgi:hypothetical protein
MGQTNTDARGAEEPCPDKKKEEQTGEDFGVEQIIDEIGDGAEQRTEGIEKTPTLLFRFGGRGGCWSGRRCGIV